MTRVVTLTLAGLICSTLWLSLLVASGFSAAAVSVGLLGMLVLMGRQR
ncbi:MAG: hypothetical protein JOZ41_01480 [Chloroflexi bacterium]|nr:hypothetical protein [Chloroflexota bacterium]